MYKDCNILSPLLDLPYDISNDDCIMWLYQIYNEVYKENPIMFKSKEVWMRESPQINNMDESFLHLLCGFECKRVYEERAVRLLWTKDIIENEPCIHNCDCEKIFLWRVKNKVKLYLKKHRYIIILKDNNRYWSFVTGYYVMDSHYHKKLCKEYHDCKTKNA